MRSSAACTPACGGGARSERRRREHVCPPDSPLGRTTGTTNDRETIDNTLNGGLVAVVVIVVAGTVGTTLYYQNSVDRLDDRTEVLSNQTQTLERNLTATRADLRAAKTRARELNQSLSVAQSDVSTLSEELKERRNRDDATAEWRESTETERRLTRVDDGHEVPEGDGTTAAEPTVTPPDAWEDSSDDGSWDDGLTDDGGYGADSTCDAAEADGRAASGETAACEG